VPSALLGGSSKPLQRWLVPGVAEELRFAFASETCGGCHQNEQSPVDVNFHISPFRQGESKISPFLNDPANPGGDELARRAEYLSASLCD
jgi:hypothetical protein